MIIATILILGMAWTTGQNNFNVQFDQPPV